MVGWIHERQHSHFLIEKFSYISFTLAQSTKRKKEISKNRRQDQRDQYRWNYKMIEFKTSFANWSTTGDENSQIKIHIFLCYTRIYAGNLQYTIEFNDNSLVNFNCIEIIRRIISLFCWHLNIFRVTEWAYTIPWPKHSILICFCLCYKLIKKIFIVVNILLQFILRTFHQQINSITVCATLVTFNFCFYLAKMNFKSIDEIDSFIAFVIRFIWLLLCHK